MEMEVDNTTLTVFTVLALVALLTIYVFTALSVTKTCPFKNSVGEVSKKYETDITPAGYTFSIWNLIFLWEAVWVLYAFGSIWRNTEDGPILMNPDVLPVELYIFWIVTCIFYVGWLFLWDREHVLLAFIDLLLLTLCGYAAVAFQGIAIANNREAFEAKSSLDLTLVYVLVQNGTDLFFAWTTLAALLNMSSALTYDPLVRRNLPAETASTISLAVLGAMVITWSVLENTVFFDYFQYVYAWYGVLVWGTVGITVKNFKRTSRNSIIVIMLLCLSIVCCVIKIAVYATKTHQ